MIRLAWAALGVLALAHGAGAQVEVRAELGWGGWAVAGEVNPLVVSVVNGSARPLAGTLQLEQRVGSTWRGQAQQRAQVPVLVPPGGQGRVLLPWPVEAVGEPLVVVLESEGDEVARTVFPVRPVPNRVVAVVGAVGTELQPPAVVLAPEDVPEDPLLLAPFAEVRIAPGTALSAGAWNALAAWVAFGGGSGEGIPTPRAIPPLGEADLRAALGRHSPRSAPAVLLLVVVAYLVVLGYVLPSLATRGRGGGVTAAVAVFLALALFYPVWYGQPQNTTFVLYSITESDVVMYGLDTLAVTSRRGGEVALSGLWMERSRPGVERAHSGMTWVWGRAGAQTRVVLEPGKTLFLYGYSPPWNGTGRPAGTEEGFAPVLGVLQPLIGEGDQLFLDREETRKGDEFWALYRVRWERRG